jgi:hypothetical protein
MRLWSLNPKYLDRQGLLAVWREGLLAKNVLEGKTKGYKNHPQLDRFKNSKDAITDINNYLVGIYQEAEKRGYKFSLDKISDLKKISNHIKVNSDQIIYEFKHLLGKLKIRDIKRYNEYKDLKKIEIHNLFKEVKGKIEKWEKIK